MLDDDSDIKAIDFDAEMRLLAGTDMQQLAQQATGTSTKSKQPLDKSELILTLGQIVRPIAQEIESIKKSASESNQLLVALGKIINSQQAVGTPAPTQTTSLETIAQQMQRLGSVESANQKLFDALHTELKGYKDNFLFDALQKPFIRELLPLFDDFSSLHGQLVKRLDTLRARDKETTAAADSKSPAGDESEFLKNLAGNVENHVHHMVEIFLRMDVELVQTTRGSPWDKKVHRNISFDPAPAPEDDGTVARSIKPGFSWKDRMIRPEDVVVHRWRASGDTAQTPAPPPATARAPLPSPSE